MSAVFALSPQAQDAVRRAWRRYAPPPRPRTGRWAERHRKLASGRIKGDFRLFNQPAQEGILDACDDPTIRQVWCQKSAQFGWTQGVLMNVIFRRIHEDPCPMILLFPKDKAFKRFNREKLVPAIKATPVIRDLIDVSRPSPLNAQDFKGFPGGFLQLAGANAPDNIKSTDAAFVGVEEPDDTIANVSDQGDPITISDERLKSFGEEGKKLVGGTPTIAKVSKIAHGMELTDKRRYFIACPHCKHEQTPKWPQVRWLKNAPVAHTVFGLHQPETARYLCANEDCGALLTQSELERAIRQAAKRPDKGWRATAPFTGRAGFYVSDLISISDGAAMAVMVRTFLAAHYKLKQGDDEGMRSFYNNQLGEPYELKGDAPPAELLKERELDYEPFTCPAGGLIITAFVDVQRGGEKSGVPRLEWALRAWGRGMESWLVARGIVVGNPLEQATWDELDKVWNQPIRNLGGGLMGVSAVGIDSGDGVTSDMVYKYVRMRQNAGIIFMATKGVRDFDLIADRQMRKSDAGREIYTPPKPIDPTSTGKSAKWGVKVYRIGTTVAKDQIFGRLKLDGAGPGCMHVYKGVGDSYYAQLLSEVKIPTKHGKLVYARVAGQANEALDCEVGMLHSAHRLRLHTFTDQMWDEVEVALRQRDLFKELPLPGKPPAPQSGAQATPMAAGGAQPFTGFSRR